MLWRPPSRSRSRSRRCTAAPPMHMSRSRSRGHRQTEEPLVGEWKEHKAPSGRTYYCNTISSSSRSGSRSNSSSIVVVVVVVVVVEDEDPAEFHSRLPAAFLAQQLLPIFEVPSFLPAQTLSNVTSQIVTAPTNFAKPCAFLASQAAAFLQRPTFRRHSVREK